MNTHELYSQLIRYLYPESSNNGMTEIKRLFPKKGDDVVADEIRYRATTRLDEALTTVAMTATDDLRGFEDTLCSKTQIDSFIENAVLEIQTFIHGGTVTLTNMANGTGGMGSNSGLAAAVTLACAFLTDDSLNTEIESAEEKKDSIEKRLLENRELRDRGAEEEKKLYDVIKNSPLLRTGLDKYKETTGGLLEQLDEEAERLNGLYNKALDEYNSAAERLRDREYTLRELLSGWLMELGIDGYEFSFDDTDVFSLEKDRTGLVSVPARIFILSLVALFRLARKNDTDYENATREAFHKLFEKRYSSYFKAKATFREAQRTLYESIIRFIPRGTDTAHYIEELYVVPGFKNNQNPSLSVENNTSVLLTGASGLGKSLYASVFSACSYVNAGMAGNEALSEIADDLNIRSRKCALMLSSKMINSFLGKAAGRNRDGITFADIFTEKIFDQTKNINYYYDGEAFGMERPKDGAVDMEAVTSYLRLLSTEGRLVFVLDAFDEIPEDFRKDYFDLLKRTKEEYQNAAFLITSRMLSGSTMDQLKRCLGVHADIEITPFDHDRQKELLNKWRDVLKISKENKEYNALYDLIVKNRFAEKFANNPFMLSVLANSYVNTNSIKTIILASSAKFCTLFNSRHSSGHFMELSDKTAEIIKKLSLISLKKTGSAIERSDVYDVIGSYDASFEISILQDLDSIVSDFLAGIGLIIPLEHSDEQYTFVNKCIPYELGSQELLNRNPDDLGSELDRIFSDDDNYEILEPLLCSIGIDDTQRIRQLLDYLSARFKASKKEEKLRIQHEFRKILAGGYSDRENILLVPGNKEIQDMVNHDILGKIQ